MTCIIQTFVLIKIQIRFSHIEKKELQEDKPLLFGLNNSYFYPFILSLSIELSDLSPHLETI